MELLEFIWKTFIFFSELKQLKQKLMVKNQVCDKSFRILNQYRHGGEGVEVVNTHKVSSAEERPGERMLNMDNLLVTVTCQNKWNENS